MTNILSTVCFLLKIKEQPNSSSDYGSGISGTRLLTRKRQTANTKQQNLTPYPHGTQGRF